MTSILKSVALVLLVASFALAEGLTPTRPVRVTRAFRQQRTGNPDVRVWVNTNSGVYHCPNTRWYGNTKSGKFMSQKEAQSRGYRPAYGAVCG